LGLSLLLAPVDEPDADYQKDYQEGEEDEVVV
jgi:hypothetical protein